VKSLRHPGAPVREAGETAGWIVRLLALAAAASAGAAGPVAALTFGRGRFDAASLALLGKALLLLTPSIVAIGLVEVASKYLLAAKRAKAVLAAQVAGLFAYLAAAPLLTRFGVGGLAIARDVSWGVAAFGLVLPLVTKERVLSARDLVTSALLACLAAPLAHAAASAVSVRPLARAAAAALVALAVFAASLPFVARRRP
jgi:putative peptidoglycan lipid II flippase